MDPRIIPFLEEQIAMELQEIIKSAEEVEKAKAEAETKRKEETPSEEVINYLSTYPTDPYTTELDYMNNLLDRMNAFIEFPMVYQSEEIQAHINSICSRIPPKSANNQIVVYLRWKLDDVSIPSQSMADYLMREDLNTLLELQSFFENKGKKHTYVSLHPTLEYVTIHNNNGLKIFLSSATHTFKTNTNRTITISKHIQP
jgi:hypothetical protein